MGNLLPMLIKNSHLPPEPAPSGVERADTSILNPKFNTQNSAFPEPNLRAKKYYPVNPVILSKKYLIAVREADTTIIHYSLFTIHYFPFAPLKKTNINLAFISPVAYAVHTV